MATNIATPIPAAPIHTFQLRWSALFGGLVVALGTWLLLTVLGLAAGLSAMNPADPASARPAGIGTGIWSLVVPLVALFIGGLVTARTAGVIDRTEGAIHGAVVWALAMMGTVALIGVVVRGVVSTAVGVTAKAASVAGSAVSGAAKSSDDIGKSLGFDINTLLAPINQRLNEQGKPSVTGGQLQAVARESGQTFVSQGGIDKEQLVASVARHTQLSDADAREVADSIETQFNQARSQLQSQLSQVGQDVQQGALVAADKTGKGLWFVFFGMLLALASAILGAFVGLSRSQREAASHSTPMVPRAV